MELNKVGDIISAVKNKNPKYKIFEVNVKYLHRISWLSRPDKEFERVIVKLNQRNFT